MLLPGGCVMAMVALEEGAAGVAVGAAAVAELAAALGVELVAPGAVADGAALVAAGVELAAGVVEAEEVDVLAAGAELAAGAAAADEASPENVPQPKDQNVTIKLVCDPASKESCDLTEPKVGDDFFVSATADSGLPAQQKVLLGNATPLWGSRTVHYRANAIGPIVIRASAPAVNCGGGLLVCDYAAAPPVDLILQVSGEPASQADACPVLPAAAGTQSKPLDAATIVSLLGNPTPFILSAEGPNTIFIYATRVPVSPEETHTLGSFQQVIAVLAGRTTGSLGITPAPAKPFTVELKIPHWSALGDLATRIGGLNYSQFTVQDVGRGSVRVTAPTQPDCETWKGFLSDIREMAWQLVSAPMSEKLFYLSSSDVATQLGTARHVISGKA